MRSDPLLLAQTTAEGKQRVESNFDVHGRVERTSERSCATEKAAASELISSLRYTRVHTRVRVPFRFRPCSDLPHARSGVNLRSVRSEQRRARCRRGVRWPRRSARGQKNPAAAEKPPKERPADRQIPSFRANNYRINYGAQARARAIHTHVARSPRHTHERTHARTRMCIGGTSATARH